jgi:N-acetylneuraminate synthase
MDGWDHKVSANPAELRLICSETKRVYAALGTTRVEVQEKPDRIESFRRSIVTTKVVRAGEVIKREDLDFKRPATGIPPEFLNQIVGRTAKIDLDFDKPFSFKDLI